MSYFSGRAIWEANMGLLNSPEEMKCTLRIYDETLALTIIYLIARFIQHVFPSLPERNDTMNAIYTVIFFWPMSKRVCI